MNPESTSTMTLIERLNAGASSVAVVGLGYVGLPLATAMAEAGVHVIGIDVDPATVESINKGQTTIPDVTSDRLMAVIDLGRLEATTDFARVSECNAISVCVPTPLRKTGDPDISFIVSAVEALAPHIRPQTVLVLESTTYPGTTREIILPILSQFQGHLLVGKDVFVAFSPERIDPGRRDWTIKTTPKVIGGVTSDCLTVAVAYYGRFIDTLVPVSSPEAAEMAKLFENTFRAVNIALANETLLMCDRLGLDVWEVMEAAGSKPFGFMKFDPGPGLGGHCIPIDPIYLSWKLKTLSYSARFIDLASEINGSMPEYWVQKIQDGLNDQSKSVKSSRILILGVAYKRDVSDVRESPALDIIHLLKQKGANVSYHDPYVSRLDNEFVRLQCVPDLEYALDQSDCVAIVTDHSSYDFRLVREHAKLVVDTRNAMAAGEKRYHTERASLTRLEGSDPRAFRALNKEHA